MTCEAAVETSERAWITSASILFVATGCLVALFWREAEGAYRVWVGSTAYNHCFLVLPLVAYLIWDRRGVLSSTVPIPELRWLLLMPILSMVWLMAASLGIHEAQQFIAATILQATVLSALGRGAYRALLAPLLYLYFLVPSGEFLVPYLQDLTASMAVHGLRLAGVPVFSNGIIIEVPAGSFIVAEECAGLRFLVASIAFGVFFAVLMYRSYLRRVAFVALSIVIPVLANGARVFGIIYAAQILGSPAAIEADHIIYGWGFFSAILVLLALLGRSFSDRRARTEALAMPAAPRFTPARGALAAFLCVALASLGPAYAAVLDDQSVADIVADAKPPALEAPWSPVTSGQADDWAPVVYGADRIFRDTVTDGTVTAYRFVALYVAHGRINNLIRGDNRIADGVRWRVTTQGTGTINVFGRTQRVDFWEIASGKHRRLVVSFYIVGGAITGILRAKLYQLRGLLEPQRQLSAFAAIAIEKPDVTTPPLETAARVLEAMRTYPDELRALSRR